MVELKAIDPSGKDTTMGFIFVTLSYWLHTIQFIFLLLAYFMEVECLATAQYVLQILFTITFVPM